MYDNYTLTWLFLNKRNGRIKGVDKTTNSKLHYTRNDFNF